MKNLLIEGSPGSGKSTLILKKLGGYIHEAAGYRTVRLLGADGRIAGFAQIRPDALKGVELGPEQVRDGIHTKEDVLHIFLRCTQAGRAYDTDVFRYFTLPSMLSAAGSFVLMDEAGGKELAYPDIYDGYMRALTSARPCIGVLKCDEHAKHFSYDDYRRFRDDISGNTPTQIVKLTPGHTDEAGALITEWMSENLPPCIRSDR